MAHVAEPEEKEATFEPLKPFIFSNYCRKAQSQLAALPRAPQPQTQLLPPGSLAQAVWEVRLGVSAGRVLKQADAHCLQSCHMSRESAVAFCSFYGEFL